MKMKNKAITELKFGVARKGVIEAPINMWVVMRIRSVLMVEMGNFRETVVVRACEEVLKEEK